MLRNEIDGLEWLRKQLDRDNDVMRDMLQEFAERLMSAEVDSMCGAEYGERSAERVNVRNGYRTREWDTRVGGIELAIPRVRRGTYLPGWLLEPRRRAERAPVPQDRAYPRGSV